MKPTTLLAQLAPRPVRSYPIESVIITASDMARRSVSAQTVAAMTLRDAALDRYGTPHPAFRWEPRAPLDAPGIDCATLDRGRDA